MVTPPALDGDYGRLRTAVVGPRDALYFTTDNGGDSDRILKVTPR
jgi:glucose/arabinose dehydrogenase